ncbi:MAG: class I SAM-dependent methyltransferase [Myxococcota bacterium]|nr:class I SAM-dependent methyltransferase [Myxococcota bacterium]
MKRVDVVAHNRVSWNRQSKRGSQWCEPVDAETVARARRGDWEVILTPLKPVPKSWFGGIGGKEVLCLASGGGQQAPVLAAAGARVVSFDLSSEQLEKDRTVATREGLSIATVQGDMVDLSAFDDGRFDLIFHPVSNMFVPDVRPVWKSCHRVLKPGGSLLAGMMNPVFYLFNQYESDESRRLEVVFRLPYSDLTDLDEETRSKLIQEKTALEFGHSLDDQIGGQIDAGFQITGFYEDWWTDEATPLNRYCPTFMATRSIKPEKGTYPSYCAFLL